MLLSRHQNVGRNQDIKIENIVWKFFTIQMFGDDSKNQNFIQEEIKRRLNSGNAHYHSVQNLPSSRLLSKNLNIRI
jgi:hypothetical protein